MGTSVDPFRDLAPADTVRPIDQFQADSIFQANHGLPQGATDPFGDLPKAKATADPFADLPTPSFGRRVFTAAESLAPTEEDVVRGTFIPGGAAIGPVLRIAGGVARQGFEDLKTLAASSLGVINAGLENKPFEPGNGTPTLKDAALAAARIGALAAGPELGSVANAAGRAAPLVRTAIGTGAGALYNPSDPTVGAALGGAAALAPEVAAAPAHFGRTTDFSAGLGDAMRQGVDEWLADVTPLASDETVRRMAVEHEPVSPASALARSADAGLAAGQARVYAREQAGRALRQRLATETTPLGDALRAYQDFLAGRISADDLASIQARLRIAQPTDATGATAAGSAIGGRPLLSLAAPQESAPSAAERYAQATVQIQDLADRLRRLAGDRRFEDLNPSEQAHAALLQSEIQRAISDRAVSAPVEQPAPVPAPPGWATEAAGPEYRHAGLPVTPSMLERAQHIATSGLVDPYPALVGRFDPLVERLNQAGASRHFANDLATRNVDWALEGLSPEQRTQFVNRLIVDNLEAVNPDAPSLAYHRAQYPAGVESAPWFKQALDNYQTYIERHIEPYAQAAGVGEGQMRRPSLGAYLKLLAVDPETGEPVSTTAGMVPRNLSPRTAKTISATAATGLAARYSEDLGDIVRSQAEKVVKGARNQVFQEVGRIGQPLEKGEAPPEGMKVVGFDDHANVVPPIGAAHRYAVPPEVSDAVAHLQKQLANRATTPFAKSNVSRALTGASLELAPAAAPYHMLTLTGKVGNVPGEGVVDELPNALPILGKRAQGIYRVLADVDFSDPETRALETRLSRAGALRPSDEERTGILSRIPVVGRAPQALHDMLFGPQGIDKRARLWLANRYLAEHPEATDEALRRFVTGIAGNYVRENSGDLVNALQDLGATAFARFHTANIGSAVKQNIGVSGLGNRPGLVARQLLRGAPATLAGIAILNRLLGNHSPNENNAGHQFDIDVTPEMNAARRAFGKAPSDQPIYMPISTLDPSFSLASRALGLKALAQGGGPVDVTRQIANTDALGFLSPASRMAFTLLTGKQPYLTRGNDFMAAGQPGATQAETMRNRFSAALGGAAGSINAAFGGGNPAARPLGGVSTVTNLMLPPLFVSGNGISPEQDEARERYFEMKDYRAAQRKNARARATAP